MTASHRAFPVRSGSDRSAPPRPPLVVVYDSLQACPYLDGRIARMPLEYPRHPLSPSDLDELLALGYRRSGRMLYRTQCPQCSECVPTRVDVREFQITRSMQRVLNRGERELEFEWAVPTVDSDRVRLFNQHRQQRSLTSSGPVGPADYHEFLVDTCAETRELVMRHDGEVVAVAVADFGQRSINAVYTHFDPAFARYSLGTLAVLKQIELARQSDRQFVYLGLYVAANSHLNYKQRFRPQQRLLSGQWRTV
nr:arginyltransferase [Roseiconus nitratireducens]